MNQVPRASSQNLIPATLIALPLIVFVIITSYSLIQDKRMVETEKSATASRISDRFGTNITLAIEEVLSQAAFAASRHNTENHTNLIRQQVFAGNSSFAIIYRDGEQISPPTDSIMLTNSEIALLKRLEGELQVGQSKMGQGLTYTRLLKQPGSEDESALYCEPIESGDDICIVMPSEKLTPIIQTAISTSEKEFQNWRFTITDANGNTVATNFAGDESNADYLFELKKPFHNWQISLVEIDNALGASIWPASVLSVLLPAFLSWLALFAYYNRRQKQLIQEKSKNAEQAAQLSHELSTPLANLSLYVDLIQRSNSNNETSNRYAEIMQQEIERLKHLNVNSISIARGESQEPHYSTHVPDQLISTLLARLEPWVHRNGCTVNFSGSANQPVLLDRLALETIINQLVENGCKHSGTDRIDIHTCIDNNCLGIIVRDYGKGIPNPVCEQIFQPGFQLNHNAEGFGLGLAAVQRFVRLNGGEIKVENANPGSRFIVQLNVHEKL